MVTIYQNKRCGAPLEWIFITLSYDISYVTYIKNWSFHNTFYHCTQIISIMSSLDSLLHLSIAHTVLLITNHRYMIRWRRTVHSRTYVDIKHMSENFSSQKKNPSTQFILDSTAGSTTKLIPFSRFFSTWGFPKPKSDFAKNISTDSIQSKTF